MQHPRHSPALDRPPHSLRRTEAEARVDLGRPSVHPAERRRDAVRVYLDYTRIEYTRATSDEERIKLMLIIAAKFKDMIQPCQEGERLVAYMDTRSGDDCQDSISNQLSDMITDLEWYLKELAEERAEAGNE